MKKRLKILIPLGIIGVSVLIYFMVIRNGEPTDTIRVSGNIEVTESRLGFKIPGKLDQRLVDEGDRVTAGQTLAVLDKRDQQTALSRAQAAYDYSQAVVAELTAGSRPQDIERTRAELAQVKAAAKAARVQLAQAKSDFERFEALYKDAGISQREYEQYKTRYETARNKSREAEARVNNAKEGLSLSEEGPRKETLDQATARMNEAKAALDQAKLQLEYTDLKAPMNGVVLTKAAEPGEYLSPGSAVLVMGDLAHPWVRAYIREQDLGRVRVGDTVQVTTDAFEHKVFEGKISFISSQAEFTPKSVQTFEERVKLMFRIKIDLDNPDGYLRPGMPADGLIFCPNPWANKS
jgi:HlyD family secretion protein